MKNVWLLLAALPFLAGCGLAFEHKLPEHASSPRERLADADYMISFWSGPSALEARRLIDEYGPPDEVGTSRLTWRGKGDWDTAMVWDAPPDYVSDGEKQVVLQKVRYPVTARSLADLRAFNDQLLIGDDLTTLGIKTNDEQAAYLTLNLADDVARGRKTPVQAREDYDRILRLRDSGKSSPYLKGLLFRFQP